jgi:type I restriction enzyme, R subunit
MTNFTESTIEQPALDWLESLGYQIAFGPDLAFDGTAPERLTYQDVILVERFKRVPVIKG